MADCAYIAPPLRTDPVNNRIYLDANALKVLDHLNAASAVNRDSEFKGNDTPFVPASEYLQNCSTDCLSELKQLAEEGGLDVQEARGVGYFSTEDKYSLANMLEGMNTPSHLISQLERFDYKSKEITRGDGTNASSATPSSSAYDEKFERNLHDHRILYSKRPPVCKCHPPPKNWNVIKQRLLRSRASLSSSKLSHSKFQSFRQKVRCGIRKQLPMRILPVLEGETPSLSRIAEGVQFNNLESLAHCCPVYGHPDIYHGADIRRLHPLLLANFNTLIVPSTRRLGLPVVPNFFLNFRTGDEDVNIAKRITLYTGALGARAIRSLQNYTRGEPGYDNRAYALSCSFVRGSLTIHVHYPLAPPFSIYEPTYMTLPIMDFTMNKDIKGFKRGIQAYRNARDLALEMREISIYYANRRADITYNRPRETTGEMSWEKFQAICQEEAKDKYRVHYGPITN